MVSVGISLVFFAALSAVNIVLFRGMNERSRLISRNDGERTFNTLFTSARDYDDFSSAIEATLSLKKKIVGLGFYAGTGTLISRWGTVPDSYTPPAFVDADVRNDMARVYVENHRNDSLILVLRSPADRPPLPLQPGPGKEGARAIPKCSTYCVEQMSFIWRSGSRSSGARRIFKPSFFRLSRSFLPPSCSSSGSSSSRISSTGSESKNRGVSSRLGGRRAHSRTKSRIRSLPSACRPASSQGQSLGRRVRSFRSSTLRWKDFP